ncbi:HAD family hydrolase [Psychromonas sp. CNPT3]|uniref:HAD family hydrolase n=1 Tax=Psychromonas sp. CNPT3 TaxID=314282 RepID=UPI00006E4899|nr:HAD-IIIA family hydrolase [Psychromonas sp. CNPT3]AGH80993.1 HAD family hydrolase [Psychromonas sp. CNPT3]
MQYKLIIFDWDGTLMNSIEKIVCCMQAAARQAQLSVPSQTLLRNSIGLSLDAAFSSLFNNGTQAQLLLFKKHYRHQYTQINKMQTPFYKGIKAYLHTLSKQGYLLAIATGKSRQGLQHQLDLHHLQDVFQCTYCAQESASKPHPLMLQKILNDLNVDVADALMIGDASFDLQMARNAGMDCIAVNYGAQSAHALSAFKPLAILDCLPTQLGKYI